MKTLFSLMAILALAGCTSSQLGRDVEVMYQMDALFCGGEGFAVYSLVQGTPIGTCKNGVRFRFDVER